MDKITHQVRVEHWAKIMNECINSGMPKTAWCRANGISEKQFFYWQRILRSAGASQKQPMCKFGCWKRRLKNEPVLMIYRIRLPREPILLKIKYKQFRMFF